MRRLLIRPGAIGDCILSLPALRHLLAEYTEVWTRSALVPLMTFADAAHSIASTGLDLAGVGDLEMPAGLRARLQSFDSIVSWYGANRPEFREIMGRIGVPCEFHAALPPAGYTGHAIDFFAAQVGAPAGLIPRIDVPPASVRPTIVIHPFSGSRRKNWSLERYRELAARLPSEVEWTAGPEEELPAATRFANLADLAAWIKGSRLFIGNDSGITHLAAATGVATLALFGPASTETWTPRGENVVVLRSSSLESLEVDDVLAAANRLLRSPLSSQSTAQPAFVLP